MMRTTALMALGAFSLGVSLPAQEQPGRSTRTAKEQAEQQEVAIEQHLQQLGSERYRERAKAERLLLALGDAALPRLREVAADDSDPEAQWRARRLIRQIESGEDAGLGRRDGAGGAPEARPQDLGGLGGSLDGMPEDLRERFEELLKRFDMDLQGGISGPGFGKDFQDKLRALQPRGLPGFGGGHSANQSMTMQMGPDGVRVEVTEKDADGKDQQKVYEAPDMETFREKYPGVLPEQGFGGRLGVGLDGVMPDLKDLFGDLPGGSADRDPKKPLDRRPLIWSTQPEDPAPAVAPPAGERLGVLVRPEIPPAVVSYLGIENGLMIAEVQPGTLANTLGVKADDILVKIGESSIATTKDVREALRVIDPGSEVAVTVLRRGNERVLRAPKPAAPAKKNYKGAVLKPRGQVRDEGR